MATRKLGYLRDPHDLRDRDLVSLQLPKELPKAFTLRAYVPQILDQGSTSSCVAHAFAQAVVIAERQRGVQLELPSRLFIYYNARRQHGGALVSDDGTYLRSAAAGLQKLGAPPEAEWRFSTGFLRVNRRPSFGSYLRAHGRRGGAYYRIGAEGSERAIAIKQALFAGMPVAFGTQVSQAFTELSSNALVDIPRASEPIAGGHAMVVIGYEDTPIGTTFEIANSWGTTWGVHGFCRFTEAYMTWSATADLWCVRGWESMVANESA